MDLMTIPWYTTKTEQVNFDKLTFIETSLTFLIPYQICTNIEEWYLYSFEYILLFNAKILTHNLLFRNKRFIIFHFASLGSVMKYVRTFELFWCFFMLVSCGSKFYLHPNKYQFSSDHVNFYGKHSMHHLDNI